MIRDRGTSIRMPVIAIVFNKLTGGELHIQAKNHTYKSIRSRFTNRFKISFNNRRRPLNPDAKTIFTVHKAAVPSHIAYIRPESNLISEYPAAARLIQNSKGSKHSRVGLL